MPAQPRPLTVHITVLGAFRLIVDGVTTDERAWPRRSAAALVKILAIAPSHRLHREQVMELLWPHQPLSVSAPRLHKAAHFARRATGHEDAIVLRDDIVWLFPGAEVTVDAVRFEQLARIAVSESDANVARQALAWYGGELLPADRYEDWAVDRRELLHLRRLDVLRVAGQWRELTELDRTDEEAHAQLIHNHLAGGDARAALREYAHLERVLDRELGVKPAHATRRALIGPNAPDEAQVAALLAELAQLVSRETVLLAELAGLVSQENVLLAELAAAGAAPAGFVSLLASAA